MYYDDIHLFYVVCSHKNNNQFVILTALLVCYYGYLRDQIFSLEKIFSFQYVCKQEFNQS